MPKLDGSIPTQNGQVKEPFTQGAYVHIVMVPARKVDIRCFHPLLLNFLFMPEGLVNDDGKLVSAADICNAASVAGAAAKAFKRPGVAHLFFDIMEETFIQDIKDQLLRLPSSTCHAANQDLKEEDMYQHLLVVHRFWVMHNQPLSVYNDTVRKQMAYQQGVSLYKTLFSNCKHHGRPTGERCL
jgi:hypothetical protein